MKAIFVIQTSPDDNQASILNDVQSRIDQLRSEFQPRPFTQYLTIEQVASLLNVSSRTVRTWTKKGKLKAHHFAHRVFYMRHQLINVNPNHR